MEQKFHWVRSGVLWKTPYPTAAVLLLLLVVLEVGGLIPAVDRLVFDQFFRCNFDRSNKENHIWVPEGRLEVIQHRMQGYQWNLCDGMQATWFVHEIGKEVVKDYSLELRGGFREVKDLGERVVDGAFLKDKDFEVSAYVMKHHGPSLAFKLTESEKFNVNAEKMDKYGLKPGKWLGELISGALKEMEIGDRKVPADEIKEMLFDQKVGVSVAYLTDFLLNDQSIEYLAQEIGGVDVMVCEAQYCKDDIELAYKYHHMTTSLSSQLAVQANAKELILFHLSERYQKSEWLNMLSEAQENFKNTHFPKDWDI